VREQAHVLEVDALQILSADVSLHLARPDLVKPVRATIPLLAEERAVDRAHSEQAAKHAPVC
jgi:hypothetical protein